jgi:hypothetical protein
MAKRRRKKPGKRREWDKGLSYDELSAVREAALVAIRDLYCESLPLWRVCPRGPCRRHKSCSGDKRACIKRGWPLMSAAEQKQAYDLVQTGGPFRRRPTTHAEKELRHFPSTNFNH